MKNNFLKNIAFIDNSFTRDLFLDLAKLLVSKHNSKIDVYCQNRQSSKVYRNKNEMFNSINLIPVSISETHEQVVSKSIFKKSLFFESKFGKSYNWYSASNRVLGRGFSPTAPNFPRFTEKKISLDYVAHYYNELMEFWDREFKEKKIRLLLCPGLVESRIGRKYGVINRSFNSSRYKSFYCWSTDEFWNNWMIQKEFKKIKYKSNMEVQLEDMPNWNASQMKEISKITNVFFLIKRILNKAKKHFYWIYIKKAKRNYKLISEIKYIIRTYFYTKFILSKKLYDINFLDKKKFIFFPLHVEPERNLQGNSPEFFNQHAALIDLSINLPSDTYLVVKEHLPAAGVRSKTFYNQLLLDYPNIIFVNASIKGIDLIKKSLAVATINGTAGLEASIIGKPVISFGLNNPYNFLSHVFVVDDQKKIKDIVQIIVNKKILIKKSIKDGQRFVEALKKISVDLPNYSTINTKFSEKDIKKCYEKLVETLI